MKRNEMVGWFSLGLNSSGIEEVQHFNDMRDAANVNGQVGKCDLIARWHVLMVRKSEVYLEKNNLFSIQLSILNKTKNLYLLLGFLI